MEMAKWCMLWGYLRYWMESARSVDGMRYGFNDDLIGDWCLVCFGTWVDGLGDVVGVILILF
jgi:hypothetical protein